MESSSYSQRVVTHLGALVGLLVGFLVGCGSPAGSPATLEAALASTAQAFDSAILAGDFATAYGYVENETAAHCGLSDCFAPLANIVYSLAKGATLEVTAPQVDGDKGTVEEPLLRGGVAIYHARGAFFTTAGAWYWHWTGNAWRLSEASAAAASVAIPSYEATPVPTPSPPAAAASLPGSIPAGWCGVRLNAGDAVLLIQDAPTICADYWVENNHLAIGGNWELATDVPLDDGLVCTGRLGNAGTPFQVWDAGDQYWGHLLCRAYQVP